MHSIVLKGAIKLFRLGIKPKAQDVDHFLKPLNSHNERPSNIHISIAVILNSSINP